MPTFTTSTALAGVAGAAAVTLAGFGANAALAETSPVPSSSSSAPSADASGDTSRPGRGGPGHGPGRMKGADVSALAKALGMDAAKVEAAIKKVREANTPTERPAEGAKPTDAEREANRTAYVTALAKELGVSADKITDALETLRDAHQAERKTALTEKLDAAVKAGTLTEADKASVLKALDVGVLGGGPR